MTDTSTEAVNAPERIWLQTGNELSGLPAMLHEVTWCDQAIDDGDQEYLRADIHSALLSERDTLKADFNDCNAERARWRGRAEAAEARARALREAIGYYEIGICAVAVPHDAERKVLHDAVKAARAIRAALEATT